MKIEDYIKEFEEFVEEVLRESTVVFGRQKAKGQRFATKQKPMFRCSSGPRAGKRVSSLSQCIQPVDAAKKRQMTLTRAKTSTRQARRASRTKRIDPGSRAASTTNRRRR